MPVPACAGTHPEHARTRLPAVTPTRGNAPAEDLSDPLQMAVKVTRIEGTLALMQQQATQGMGNMTNALASLQAELRELTHRLSDVASGQHEFATQSSALQQLSRSIDAHVRDYSEWRKVHESDNRAVADHVTAARGALKLVAWSGVFVIGLLVFTVQMQFNAAQSERLRMEQQHATDVGRIERMLERRGITQ